MKSDPQPSPDLDAPTAPARAMAAIRIRQKLQPAAEQATKTLRPLRLKLLSEGRGHFQSGPDWSGSEIRMEEVRAVLRKCFADEATPLDKLSPRSP